MKLIISVTTGLLSFLATSTIAYAYCPDNLNQAKMTECIMIEGSGANYQDWLAHYNSKDNINYEQSTVSPITGKDILKIKPAAGTSN